MELDALWQLLAGVCLLFWLWSLNLGWRWRCRHLPGPRPSWLVGNVLDFPMGAAREIFIGWTESYGAVFVWYMGRKPCIVLSDPDLIGEAAITNFSKLHDRSAFQICPGMAIEAKFMNTGLFASKGKSWAHARAVLQQFFTREELVEHTRKMNFSADRLVAFIAANASAGTEFEATYTFSKMGMEVIGATAFGVDFQIQTSLPDTPPRSFTTSSSPSSPSNKDSGRKYGLDLLTAAKSMFQPLGLRGNKARVVLGLAPLLVWIQRRGVAIGNRAKPLKSMSLGRCFIWGVLHGILEHSSGADGPESIDTRQKEAIRDGRSKTEKSGRHETRSLPQCPMHALGPIRAKSFSDGKNSLPSAVPDTPLLYKLLRNTVDPITEKPLTEFDMCAQGFNMIVGAYETTALGLSYTLYELAKRPAMQRRIAEEIAALRALKKKELLSSSSGKQTIDSKEDSSTDILYEDIKHLPFTEACFLEGLRLWPPVSPLVPMSRHALEEVNLSGYIIPKGACVMLNVWHVHQNPKYYPNPEEYTPERFLPNHPEMKTRHKQAFLPFGAGPRKCIGKTFAIAEAVTALAKLLEQFEFRVDMTRSAKLHLIATATVQPTNGIWLKVFKRGEERGS